MAASSEHFVARAGGQDGHASLKRMSTADVSVRERLDTARAEGQRFRLRVQLPLVALGMLINVTVMAVGVVMIAHMLTGSARSDAVTVVYYVLLLPGPLAAIFILFALLPTDTGVILKLAYGGAFSGCLMFSAISAWQAVLDAIEMSRPRRAGAGSCVHWQLGEMPCWFAAFPLAWHLMCTLFPLYDGKQIAQLVSAIGRGGGGARVEPVPRILGRTLVTVGLVQLFGLLASAIVGVYRFEPHHPQRGFWLVFCALTAELLLVGPLLVHGGLRQRMQTWLASRGEAISAAAGVAGLLGNHAPEAVQAKAAEIFRSVTLDRLTLADMRESTPNPALYTRSEPATFARVDAFVSHSWRDDADAKWTELSEWCAAFQRRAGRQPRLWIDKVCLDQTQIEDNLMCLPVFLAGCNQLLILAGSTYLSRLWCVVELFVFLEMGGSMKRVEIKQVATEREARAEGGRALWARRIAAFDAGGASCKLEADRERLLGTIEAGFGGYEAFNRAIRATLLEAAGVQHLATGGDERASEVLIMGPGMAAADAGAEQKTIQ